MNLKQQAASHAITYVKSGMVMGLGSGSTTKYFIEILAEKLKSGELHDIAGVPTSEGVAQLARVQGIPLVSLAELSPGDAIPALDLAVDGADEIDPNLNLVKGLGRALLREKIVESHANYFIVIADESKLVTRLGQGPLPIEIVPYEAEVHIRWLNSLGCRAELWLEEGGEPIITDNANYLVRCWHAHGIPDPYQLARDLADRPGVVEHGLFLDMADLAIVAGLEGVQLKERK
ncbi:MAG: ribose-5-phosphate isomerase RpiA [Chloroflexi bacterium]|nr:ribose-5-phosphate isomerase RpiA [Chloroflexota bacterium]